MEHGGRSRGPVQMQVMLCADGGHHAADGDAHGHAQIAHGGEHPAADAKVGARHAAHNGAVIGCLKESGADPHQRHGNDDGEEEAMRRAVGKPGQSQRHQRFAHRGQQTLASSGAMINTDNTAARILHCRGWGALVTDWDITTGSIPQIGLLQSYPVTRKHQNGRVGAGSPLPPGRISIRRHRQVYSANGDSPGGRGLPAPT